MLVIETYNAGGLQISVARSDSSYMEGMKPVSLIVAFQKILKGNRMGQISSLEVIPKKTR